LLGIAGVAKSNNSTGVIYFINSDTKLLISTISVTKTTEEIKQAFDQSLAKLNSRDFDIFISNDLDTLPLAINLAKRCNAKVFFDAHEYAPLEFDNRWSWKYLHQPFREYLCRQYLKGADVMTTVCDGIAQKYQNEYQSYLIPYFAHLIAACIQHL
jgi:hypothetical protein